MALYGTRLCICQTWPLRKQYEAGIRFVDIRCRETSNGIQIYHGQIPQRVSFHEVMKETVLYLATHPSEIILMRIKIEKQDHRSESLLKSVRSVLESFPQEVIWDGVCIPRVGVARGKVIILQDFAGVPPIGIDYKEKTIISDDWRVSNISYTHIKWMKAKEFINEVRGTKHPEKLCITFTSGSGIGLNFGPSPRSVADQVNSQLRMYLNKLETNKEYRLGVIVMDFPSSELISGIIKANN